MSFDLRTQKAECLQPDLLIEFPSVHDVFIAVGGILLLVTLHLTGKKRVRIDTASAGLIDFGICPSLLKQLHDEVVAIATAVRKEVFRSDRYLCRASLFVLVQSRVINSHRFLLLLLSFPRFVSHRNEAKAPRREET